MQNQQHTLDLRLSLTPFSVFKTVSSSSAKTTTGALGCSWPATHEVWVVPGLLTEILADSIRCCCFSADKKNRRYAHTSGHTGLGTTSILHQNLIYLLKDVHSFIFITAYPFCRVIGGLEPISANTGRGRGSPLTSHQFTAGLTFRDKQPFTLTFTPTGHFVIN